MADEQKREDPETPDRAETGEPAEAAEIGGAAAEAGGEAASADSSDAADAGAESGGEPAPGDQAPGVAPVAGKEVAQEAEATAGAPSPEPVIAEEAPGAPAPEAQAQPDEREEDEEVSAPREKPSVPGAHLEVDIVPEGVDPLGRAEEYEDPYALEEEAADQLEESEREELEEALPEPIATAAIDLAAGARYRATGKRKTAIARVTLRPGTGTYLVNGRALEDHFPRITLQRNIRQPLETVGYEDRMDVLARLHGGGISAQAGALRHGVSRALLEADPNLRGELKRRGFLTRDSRAKERKKAGLKKARKRPQFSKR